MALTTLTHCYHQFWIQIQLQLFFQWFQCTLGWLGELWGRCWEWRIRKRFGSWRTLAEESPSASHSKACNVLLFLSCPPKCFPRCFFWDASTWKTAAMLDYIVLIKVFSGNDARQATAGWCSACSRSRAWVCNCGQEPPSSQPPPSPNYYHDNNNCGLWFRHRVILHWLGCDRFRRLLCGRSQHRISRRVNQLRQMLWIDQGQMAVCRSRQRLLYSCCSIQRW